MGTNNIQTVRFLTPDGKTGIRYSSRQNIDVTEDAVRQSNAEFAKKNIGGSNDKDRLGASLSFAWSWEGRPDKSNSPTVGEDPIKKTSSRKAALKRSAFAPGKKSYALKNEKDFEYFVDAHRENFSIHKYPDGKVEYRELGTGKILNNQKHEQAMNKVLAKTGEVYTIKNRGELVDVAKRTGIDIKTLEKLNPELKGKKLTAGMQVRLQADETKEMANASAPVSNEGIYTIKNGGQLKHVSMRTGIPVETLEKLNPELKGKKLTAGTNVRLI